MYFEKRGVALFIGWKKEANPTSNRCGIAYLTKSNIDDSHSASLTLKKWRPHEVHLTIHILGE